MATLVLTGVGKALGGPIGGAVGALIGGGIDRRLFGERQTRGPRLADLKVQTSAYGTTIPRLYGTLRVAGTVIWAADLIETRTTSGGGKSGPRTQSFAYAASFAVALSARPIVRVGRIWADGRLLRGAAGDWKAETGFRLHLGDADQPADPLIAAVEGMAAAPAHRGIAYAVFERLQLADFGNRIPSLSFEVVADEAAVTVGAIAADLGGGAVAGRAGPALAGYASAADSLRAGLEGLAAACPIELTDDGGTLRIDPPAGVRRTIAAAELGVGGAAQAIDRTAAALPDEVSIAYYEPARDHQAGLQRARRAGPPQRTVAIELAAALPAEAARGLAEAALARAWTERERATVRVGWRHMDLKPGDRIRIGDDPGVWRIARTTLEGMAVELALVRAAAAPIPAVMAGAGRQAAAADHSIGATRLVPIDLPPTDETPATEPAIWVAAAGGPGWRRAALSLSIDGGAGWEAIGETAGAAVIGTLVSAVPPAGSALVDRRTVLTVDLAHAEMTLATVPERALHAGANPTMLGGELIQFATAEQTGPRRWRLSTLLRGRRGTEAAAAAGHAAGIALVAIEPGALRRVALPPAMLGRPVLVGARGIGDSDMVVAEAVAAGRALRPPPPVAIRAWRMGDAIAIGWRRRSRIGWGWTDGAETPLGEEREAYRLTVSTGGIVRRSAETATPGWTYPAAWQAADGAGAFTVTIEQLGTHAPSLPATRTFTHEELFA
ncbi:MAG: phage tail protein [Sphingomonas fennica]